MGIRGCGTYGAAAAVGRRRGGHRRGVAGRTAPRRGGSNSDAGRAAAVVSLGGDDLVVMRAEVQSDAGPCIEVVCGGDAAADALGGADGPVLLEGGGADDGGLIGAGGHVDVVG